MADEEKHTTCSKCGGARAVGEKCKPCVSEYSAAYNLKNRARVRARKIAYRAENREKIAAYKSANKERMAKYGSAYYYAHKDEIAARRKRWRIEHKGSIDLYEARRRREHPNRVKARRALNLAIKAGKMKRRPCEGCDQPPEKVNGRQVIEFHHAYGYEPENWLRGQWICSRCHPYADALLAAAS